MANYAVKKIDEMDAALGGAYKRARAELGVSFFGMQVLDFPPNADQYPEHDHAGDGQEEVYVVLRGGGEIDIDGERHPLDTETMARVGAGTSRKIYAGDDGLRLLALGGVPGQAYSPPDHSQIGNEGPPLPASA